MKKIQIEICCGTTCYMLGANRLLNLENEMPSELRGRAEIRALPCMSLCNDTELTGAPYVKVNGEVIEKATFEKVCDKVRELIEE